MSAKVLTLPNFRRWDYALLIPGEYDATVLDNETCIYFRGATKLIVWFEVDGFVLPNFYAVPGLAGKPRRNGDYHTIGPCSRLYRDLAAMLGTRPSKIDRRSFPIERLRGHTFVVEVVTVTTDQQQHELASGAQYSRVLRVLP